MTPEKVIEQVDRLHPNGFTDEDKMMWISELDGMVKQLVQQDEEVSELVYPDDMNTELLIPHPYDRCYLLYVDAMLFYRSTDIPAYNNAAVVFRNLFDEYKKHYIRQNEPLNYGEIKW